MVYKELLFDKKLSIRLGRSDTCYNSVAWKFLHRFGTTALTKCENCER